ncbi:MAG TPA: pilus assembly protein PilP [Candidatus Binatia bacterium]|nr:pilus assembly protein PilP [Candidatus Binatia bacterium]
MRLATFGLVGLALLLPSGAPRAADQAPAASAQPPEQADAPYDPAGRRDPFRPPKATSATAAGEARTPLERYELGQLRLVAVIYDTREPRAVVEDDSGLGYIVRKGTRIGPNGGIVDDIERGRVRVREDYVDFYGEHHPTDVTMELKVAERGKR